MGQTFSCNFLFLISWRMSECIQISFAICRVGIYTVSNVCFCSSKCHENINEVLASTWSNGNVLHCWWECRFVQPLWKEIKLSASILNDVGKSTPRCIYISEKLCNYKMTYVGNVHRRNIHKNTILEMSISNRLD